jgi:hypothetical protein
VPDQLCIKTIQNQGVGARSRISFATAAPNFYPQPIRNPVTKMKNRSKSNNDSASTLERKPSPVRIGTKTSSHRYERRKIREQLRHLDWALAGVD